MSTFLEQEPDDYARILKELRDEAESEEFPNSWRATLQAEIDRRKRLQH